MDINTNEIFQGLAQKGIDLGIKVVLAIILAFIGFKVVNYVSRIVEKGFEKSKMEVSVSKFLASLIRVVLKLAILVSIASFLGVATSSFVALIGSAGLAIGLALQGSLSNFAGGILIILFKPFIVGDYIEAAGHMGVVESIQILNTTLNTLDNKKIVIPNGMLSNSSVTNYSRNALRRVDFNFGVDYSCDIKHVKSILEKIANEQSLALKDPAPSILFGGMKDSSIDFIVRIWTKNENYWDVFFDVNEKVKEAFDKEGIKVPYKHMEILMNKEK